MNRSTAAQVALCLTVLSAFGSAAQTRPGDRTDPGGAFSDAGTHIKKGAEDLGKGIKQSAELVGEKIKSTAIDVWEAGKAAVDAGSRRMNERHSPPASPPAKE
jgi:hypothetical protein